MRKGGGGRCLAACSSASGPPVPPVLPFSMCTGRPMWVCPSCAAGAIKSGGACAAGCALCTGGAVQWVLCLERALLPVCQAGSVGDVSLYVAHHLNHVCLMSWHSLPRMAGPDKANALKPPAAVLGGVAVWGGANQNRSTVVEEAGFSFPGESPPAGPPPPPKRAQMTGPPKSYRV